MYLNWSNCTWCTKFTKCTKLIYTKNLKVHDEPKVISSDLPYKDSNDLQQYPWNLKLIRNEKDNVVFLTRKVFTCICEFLCYSRRETANENKQFKETKTLIYNSYLIRQSFQGYRCKSWHCHFCIEGHLKLRVQSL